jgi:hypothetical protein
MGFDQKSYIRVASSRLETRRWCIKRKKVLRIIHTRRKRKVESLQRSVQRNSEANVAEELHSRLQWRHVHASV